MTEEEKAKPEKPAKAVKEAKIVEITTQTSPAIELEDGRVVDMIDLLVLIYNKLLKIEKSVA